MNDPNAASVSIQYPRTGTSTIRDRHDMQTCIGYHIPSLDWFHAAGTHSESTHLIGDIFMPRIAWIDENEADGALRKLYDKWLKAYPDREAVPGILKCFSQRPDFLADVMSFAYRVHFTDGHLTRRVKEMIATYVSALNRCKY